MNHTGLLPCITAAAPMVGDTASFLDHGPPFFFFFSLPISLFLGIFHARQFKFCWISPQRDNCGVWYVVIHIYRGQEMMTQVTGNGSQIGSYRWDSDERKEVSSVE